jgi:hypothetical protein
MPAEGVCAAWKMKWAFGSLKMAAQIKLYAISSAASMGSAPCLRPFRGGGGSPRAAVHLLVCRPLVAERIHHLRSEAWRIDLQDDGGEPPRSIDMLRAYVRDTELFVMRACSDAATPTGAM